jgi:hypothetical protein
LRVQRKTHSIYPYNITAGRVEKSTEKTGKGERTHLFLNNVSSILANKTWTRQNKNERKLYLKAKKRCFGKSFPKHLNIMG